MADNITVSLNLENSLFNGKLNQSIQMVAEFENKVKASSKGVQGAIQGLLNPIQLAFSAFNTFKQVVDIASSVSEDFAKTVKIAEDGVDAFFYISYSGKCI